jgi:RNA polymerase sigma-70 factor (ECF subfamily)
MAAASAEAMKRRLFIGISKNVSEFTYRDNGRRHLPAAASEEVFVRRGKKVTLIDKLSDDMSAQDPDTNPLGQLMRAAQQGDSTAYVELLRAVTPKIRQIVQRQRGFAGREEVEDIVQEILLSVHQVRATYDSSRPFIPWLLAIVRNRLADGARRFSRTVGREVPMDESDVTFWERPANLEDGEPDDADTLRKAVRALPEGQRRAIELLKLKELSLKEAASITGSSESALKVATHRALATLRKKLGEK